MKKLTTTNQHEKATTAAAAAAIGIDLGDRSSYYACINDAGEIFESGTVEMKPAAFLRLFGSMPVTRIAIEAGAQSRWVAALLADLGHEVLIANPRQLPLITQSDSKNDARDAAMLARIARFDPSMLHALEHRPEQDQNTLLAIRARAQLVKARVAMTHNLRGLLKSYGIRLPRASGANYIERCREIVPSALMTQLEGLLQVVAELSRQIENYDEQIERLAVERYGELVNRLRGVPGVGTLTAVTFVATLGDATRFQASRDAAAYLGLRPRQQQSGQRNPQLGITKAGDSYLRMLLVQCAHCLLHRQGAGPDSALRRWGLKLCERGGSNAKKRAVVAVARKLAVLLHKLWVSGATYRPFPAGAA